VATLPCVDYAQLLKTLCLEFAMLRVCTFIAACLLSCFLTDTGYSQVPDSTWACLLDHCQVTGAQMGTDQAHLSPRQSLAISHWVQQQSRRDPQNWEGERVCPAGTVVDDDDPISLQCLDIRTLPSGPDVFWVSQRWGSNNPCFWILRVRGVHAIELLADGFGGAEVQPAVHHGFHDIVMDWGMGVQNPGLAYLQFDVTRYRTLGSHNFSTCSQLPGHSPEDQRWCFEDGRPVSGS
jgi:hypothetical protein